MIWIFLLVNHQGSSETSTSDIPRHLHISIFENTSLIKKLIILFQDSDPTLSIMPTIWKSMCLSAFMRESDRTHLLLSMKDHPTNQKFLGTLAACFIYQKVQCVRSTSTQKITKPHVDRICDLDEVIRGAFPPVFRKRDGEEYLWYWDLTSASKEISGPKIFWIPLPISLSFADESAWAKIYEDTFASKRVANQITKVSEILIDHIATDLADGSPSWFCLTIWHLYWSNVWLDVWVWTGQKFWSLSLYPIKQGLYLLFFLAQLTCNFVMFHCFCFKEFQWNQVALWYSITFFWTPKCMD